MAPEPEKRTPHAVMPFLRIRTTDRWWRLALGFLWMPAIVLVITVGDLVHLPAAVIWVSLGVLLVSFLAFAFLTDRTAG